MFRFTKHGTNSEFLMFSHKRILIIGLLTLSIFMFACAGLPAIENTNETVDIPLGPQITLTEHQTNVFESILLQMQENYIHYETSDIDWDTLRQKYLDEINKGLTPTQFNDLMTQFESEFGVEEVIYVSREEKIQAQTTVATTQFVGIGVIVSFQVEDEPHLTILDVLPDSPAQKAGIQPHDNIYAVDGESLTEEEGAGITQRIRGEAGTVVTLTIQTPGENKREVEITRASINGVGELKANLIPNTDILYVLMPSSVSEDIMNQLVLVLSNYFETDTAKGLILDLRISNSGNFPIDEMISVFLNGELGDIYNREESQVINVEGQDYFGSQTIPLTILVGEHTNGMAEVFAAFAESSGRGIVIGSDTEGNIESEIGFPLPDGGEIFIASTAIRVKDNQNIGITGFSPKFQNEAHWDEINPAADPVIEQAVQSFNLEEVQE